MPKNAYLLIKKYFIGKDTMHHLSLFAGGGSDLQFVKKKKNQYQRSTIKQNAIKRGMPINIKIL